LQSPRGGSLALCLVVSNVRLKQAVAEAHNPLGPLSHFVFVRNHDDGSPFVVELVKEG
jgi:hypothetical protein